MSNMFSLPKTLSAHFLNVSPFKRVVLFRTLKRVVARHLLFLKFNTLLCLTALLVCARLLFLVCPTKQKSLLMKCAPEHALSVLKSNSFISKWKRVVSVLSPLSLFSCGGSQMCLWKLWSATGFALSSHTYQCKQSTNFASLLHVSPNCNISRSMDYFEFFSTYLCLWSSFNGIQIQSNSLKRH